MSDQEFKAFMEQLAAVMSANASMPTDMSMYLAMRKWLHRRLVTPGVNS